MHLISSQCEDLCCKMTQRVFFWFRLREESTLEAERTGELVKSLGMEHHIVSLDWSEGGGLPRRGKVQLAAREKRYPALLQFCRKMDVRTLMVAHNLDDQNGQFS
jgi:tRNA(Ile)-lysidine synthase TilS/MesJ